MVIVLFRRVGYRAIGDGVRRFDCISLVSFAESEEGFFRRNC